MLIIRNSVRKELVEKIPSLIERALAWMKKRYPHVNFNNCEYIFSSNYNRSRYFRNEEKNPNSKNEYNKPTVTISTRATLYLYEKRSLKLKLWKLFVGSEIQILCALIHELTHHVQYEENKRKGNELDTTKNEVEFLEENYFEYYNKLKNG